MDKPYCLPDDAPDAEFVRCYRDFVIRNRRWLSGLRRDDGTPYLVGQGAMDSCNSPYHQTSTTADMEPMPVYPD